MSDYTSVLYRSADRVAHITLNRPKALNSFDAALRAELPQALRRAAGDADVRAVVLDGAGRGFGAGADLKEGIARDLQKQLNEEYRPIFDAIEVCPKPVISAIGGMAAGISLSVALMCDLTVMAEDAYLLAPFAAIALVPDGGMHYLIGRQIGYKRAYELFVEGRRLGAGEARELGLVNRVVPAAGLETAALEWAASLAQRAPLALANTKTILRRAMHADYDAVFRLEAELQQVCRESEDAAEGVAAFTEKRAPTFVGR